MHFLRNKRRSIWVILCAVICFIWPLSSMPRLVESHRSPGIPAIHHIQKRDLPPSSILRIAGLKAVLIAGPIDGVEGDATLEEIANLKLAAFELRKNKVKVVEFYAPHNNWHQIRREARGAHFLLYRGHGVYDGSIPPKRVGGFSLSNRFASSEDIRRELKLAPGAIVMLYGCFTAGNSGFDVGKIDSREARNRVSQYSQPFLANGAAGYFANWYGDAFQYYIAYLFAGYELGQAYRAYRDFDKKTSEFSTHLSLKKNVIWLDHDNWKAGRAYNNAFAGRPGQTLQDLFGGELVQKKSAQLKASNI